MKKNALLTFIFACVPGAGQMYYGYMQRGLSLIALFCGGLIAWAEGQAARLDALVEERGVPSAEATEWMEAGSYTITADNALDIVYKETGLVFAKVLEHAGVYARTPEGQDAFLRFLRQV